MSGENGVFCQSWKGQQKCEGGFRRKTNGRPNNGKKIQNCLLLQTCVIRLNSWESGRYVGGRLEGDVGVLK